MSNEQSSSHIKQISVVVALYRWLKIVGLNRLFFYYLNSLQFMVPDNNSKRSWKSSLTAISTVLLVASSAVAAAADVLPVTAGVSNSSLLWGTYRPNLYFGTRPRIPESVMTGLMWFDASDFQGFQRKWTSKCRGSMLY